MDIQALIDGLKNPPAGDDRAAFMEAMIEHLLDKPDPRVVLALVNSLPEEVVSKIFDDFTVQFTERDERVGRLMLRVFKTGPKELQQRVADQLRSGPISDEELDKLEALPELDEDYLSHLEAEAERHFAETH